MFPLSRHPEIREALRQEELQPTLGPAICHECKAPGMFYWLFIGWAQRVVLEVVMGVPVYTYIEHVCTARDTPEQLRG